MAFAGEAAAGLVTGIGTVEVVSDGPYAGWYRYTYEVTWDLPKALSHLDLVLKTGCLQPDHLFRFDTMAGGPQDGLSTGDGWAPPQPVQLVVPYTGGFEPGGDPSVGLAAPLVKWEPNEAYGEPGAAGVGRFWYYSNVIPEYGTIENVLVIKNGRNIDWGDLVGAYPSCQVDPHTPEPASLVLLVTGAAGTMLLRRRQ